VMEAVAAGKIAGRLRPEQQGWTQAAVPLKFEQAAREAATGFARCHAIWHLGLPAVFLRPQEQRECESSLFSVRLVRSSSKISTKKFAQEKDCCHVLSTLCQKIPFVSTRLSPADRSHGFPRSSAKQTRRLGPPSIK
jgi:hypothetical protein